MKSDIRRIINKNFTKINVVIVFPQMDLLLKFNNCEKSRQ
jgi:small-conductance mechanosensitive channel